MKKKVFGRHFSRSRKAREALFKSLVKDFILHGKMNTTLAKAKAVQKDIDRVVTFAKRTDGSKDREIASLLSADRIFVEKFTKEIAPTFKTRNGGFTRIIKLPSRKGDAAQMARIEWVDAVVEAPKTAKKESKVPKAKKTVKKEKREVKIKPAPKKNK